MSRFSILRHLGSTTSTGSPYYDTRFGTDSPATINANLGWFTFGLRPGCRRVWCNSSRADDSGDGLSAATAKKTYGAALGVYTSGYTAGDQLMLAGTGGRTYLDSGYVVLGQTLTGVAGYSLAYPAAILCYDPANPSDSTKYGRLYGADQPILQLDQTTSGPATNKGGAYDPNDNYFAMQGITVDAQNHEGWGLTWTGRHDGLCFQNCRWVQAELAIDNANSVNGLSQTINVSKCSFYGQWASSGNAAGGYSHKMDGQYIQDCVFIHCGWKLGLTRGAAVNVGGPYQQSHGWYYSATNRNGRQDRNVYARSAADGFNCRGAATCTQMVSLREPIAVNIGGFSGSLSEAPNGVLITIDDYVVMEGDDMSTRLIGDSRGLGITSTNTQNGSYLKNAVFADNSQYGDTNNHLIERYSGGDPIGTLTHSGTTATVTIDTAHGYTYIPANGALVTVDGASPSEYNVTQAAITVLNSTQFTYQMASAPATNATVNGSYTDQQPQYLTISQLRSYGYSPIFYVGTGLPVPRLENHTFTDVIADDLAPGTGNSVATSGTFPLRKTYAQLITALGFASENAMCDAMVEYPHLPWAQAIHGIMLPAFGLTPQFTTTSVPDLSGLPTPRTISW